MGRKKSHSPKTRRSKNLKMTNSKRLLRKKKRRKSPSNLPPLMTKKPRRIKTKLPPSKKKMRSPPAPTPWNHPLPKLVIKPSEVDIEDPVTEGPTDAAIDM